MLIKAPANSFEMAKAVIEAGADELYVGLPSAQMENITLSGRGNKTLNGKNFQVNDEAELKEIVKIAKEKNKRVDFTLNNPFFVSEQAEELLVKQIEQAVDAGVDAFIVADLYVAHLVKKIAPDIKLCASSFFDVYNRANIDFLRDEGFDRVVLAYDLHKEELNSLCQNKEIEYEVFGHFGCSLKLGPCMLLHGSGENLKLGLPCRNMYCVETKKGGSEEPLIDSAKDCSICSMDYLIKCNVDVIKIIGRGKNISFIASLVYVYRRVIDELKAGKEIHEIRKEILESVPWWKEVFCNCNRCKYKRADENKDLIE